MPSNHTANYQLNQWVKSDQVKMEDFNADNAKIDAAIKAEADARAAAVAALSQTVSGHTSTLTHKGNCQIGIFSYRGTDTSGQTGPTKLTFPKRPLFFAVFGEEVHGLGTSWSSSMVVSNEDRGGSSLPGSWNGNTYSFYSYRADYQMNMSSQTYYVVYFYSVD